MQRRFRLQRESDFQRVRRTGKSYAHPLIVLVVAPSESPAVRVGVAASRAVGTAVRRNRARRLLREAVRPLLPRFAAGRDVLLVARASAGEASLRDIRLALEGLAHRAGLLANGTGTHTG